MTYHPAKRSQQKCNSQQRQNSAPEFVGFTQHNFKNCESHYRVKAKLMVCCRSTSFVLVSIFSCLSFGYNTETKMIPVLASFLTLALI